MIIFVLHIVVDKTQQIQIIRDGKLKYSFNVANFQIFWVGMMSNDINYRFLLNFVIFKQL